MASRINRQKVRKREVLMERKRALSGSQMGVCISMSGKLLAGHRPTLTRSPVSLGAVGFSLLPSGLCDCRPNEPQSLTVLCAPWSCRKLDVAVGSSVRC